MSTPRKTIVVLTTGKQDRGTRATIAFAWACTALALGQEVTLFLTMDGALWATHGAMRGIRAEGFEPLHSYHEQFLALGGKLKVCAPCALFYCNVDKNQGRGDLHSAVKVAGLSSIVSEADERSQVVTF